MEVIIESMQSEPLRWKQTRYTLDRDDGVEIWIANGKGHYGVYQLGRGESVRPMVRSVFRGFGAQRRFHKALHKWENDVVLAEPAGGD